MARGRMISRTLSTSEKRAALHHAAGKLAEFCQAIFPLLVAHADDYGRLAGDVFTVKHAIDPTSPRRLSEFHAALVALDCVRLIDWYEVDGKRVIEIVKFDAHQDLHKRAKKSAFPDFPGIPGNPRESPESPPELKRTEENRTEGKRDSSEPQAAAEPAALTAPAVLVFPTVGADGDRWGLSDFQVLEWSGLFPSLNVLDESRKALAWVTAHQDRRKTARGMPKFLVGWLTRAVDSGRSRAGPVPFTKTSGNAGNLQRFIANGAK